MLPATRVTIEKQTQTSRNRIIVVLQSFQQATIQQVTKMAGLSMQEILAEAESFSEPGKQ
jgi:hypothetical protein